MSKKEEKKAVETLCPLCWRPETEKVEGDLPCVECQEGMKKGFLLVGVDFSKSDDVKNAIRTGHRWIVGEAAAKEMYTPEAFAKGAGLLDIQEAKQLGLPIQISTPKELPKEEKGGPTMCGICGEAIGTGELGGIDPIKGLMHKKCTPLTLIKG